jgi:hypothetical protein
MHRKGHASQPPSLPGSAAAQQHCKATEAGPHTPGARHREEAFVETPHERRFGHGLSRGPDASLVQAERVVQDHPLGLT